MISSINSIRYRFHQFICRRYCHNIRSLDTIRKILDYGQPSDCYQYKVYGWIRGKIQKKKSKWFLQLDDGSSAERLQVIIPVSLMELNDRSRIQNGASLECIGRLSESLGHQQSLDFLCDQFTVIGDCPPDHYQIGHLKSGMEFDLLREQIHLRPRVRYFQSILRIRNELSRAIHKFMSDNQFIEVQVPLITANDCEGGGECFTLNPANWPITNPERLYFGRPTYLTVSGQLHLEAMASSLSRVYCLSSVFRAEKSMSPKHLSEFLMLELEQAFLFDLKTLMSLVESLFRYLLDEIEKNCQKDLEFLLDMNQHHKYYDKLKSSKFLQISHQDACQMLSNKYPQLNENRKMNLNAEMERFILEICDHQPIFVTNFPMEIKPFYMKSTDDGTMAQCFDLLTPICGEVCGGSLRENRLERLVEQIKSKNVINNTNQLEWYLDLRRFGSVPTGGFGFGFDRFLQTVCGVVNIKDVVPFPRWPYHCRL
ncbi:asparagine--tRNA ligase-like isoform X1 [Dermatophagoides pteronyssinus]|uniref:asparagine--tRNA ligase-like isoform X1 n=2 Tax=Dermatophagoides pteronyssinus TaxID=6956 RepID=UPI003F672FDC